MSLRVTILAGLAILGRLGVQLRCIDQRRDHEAICAAGNVVYPCDSENPIHIGVFRHGSRDAIQRTEHRGGVHIAAAEQGDQEFVAGKFSAQLAFEHGRRRILREIQAGCIVKAEPEQQGGTDHVDEHDERDRCFPAHDARLAYAQDERVLRHPQPQMAQPVDQVHASA